MNIAFILDHQLMEYRVPFFNQLNKKYGHNIVVYHPGKLNSSESLQFKQVITRDFKLFNTFFFRKDIESSNYDVIICMQNMRMLNLWGLSFNIFRKYKLIQWGIGVSSRRGLDAERPISKFIRNILISFADAVVFYTPYSLQFIKQSNLNKCFVAQNTIYNNLSEDYSLCPKSSFLFIGSLNKRKGLDEMIKVFHRYLNSNPRNINKLYIIGDGEEYININDYILKNSLQDHIILLGKIDNMERKLYYFKQSIASISLNQAGLSVLESFSFAVPFITKSNAISGGEHLNVINNENGFVIKKTDDLLHILMHLDNNIEIGNKMGYNAFKYYHKHASMDIMVNKFEDAIQYATR